QTRSPSAQSRSAPAPAAAASSSAAAWQNIALYPSINPYRPNAVMGNAVAYDPVSHDLYSVGGAAALPISDFRTPVASGYVYDPSAKAWSPITPAPQALIEARAAFVNGTLYLVGGLTVDPKGNTTPSAAMYAYNPGADSWSQVASLPAALTGTATAVLNGQLYVVGGCTDPDQTHGVSYLSPDCSG